MFLAQFVGWFLIVGGLAVALKYNDGLRDWWSSQSKLMALLSSLVARLRFGCLLLCWGIWFCLLLGPCLCFFSFCILGCMYWEMVLW